MLEEMLETTVISIQKEELHCNRNKIQSRISSN